VQVLVAASGAGYFAQARRQQYINCFLSPIHHIHARTRVYTRIYTHLHAHTKPSRRVTRAMLYARTYTRTHPHAHTHSGSKLNQFTIMHLPLKKFFENHVENHAMMVIIKECVYAISDSMAFAIPPLHVSGGSGR
jgi:hypothetical protein